MLMECGNIGHKVGQIHRYGADGVYDHQTVPCRHGSAHHGGIQGIEARAQHGQYLVGNFQCVVIPEQASAVPPLEACKIPQGDSIVIQHLGRHIGQAHLFGIVVQEKAPLNVGCVPLDFLHVVAFGNRLLITPRTQKSCRKGDERKQYQPRINREQQYRVCQQGKQLGNQLFQIPKHLYCPVFDLRHCLQVLFVIGGIFIAGQLHRLHFGVHPPPQAQFQLYVAPCRNTFPEPLLQKSQSNVQSKQKPY